VNTAADISQVTDAARTAARALANATTQAKNRGLEAIAAALVERSDQILAANAEDVARGRAEQMSEGLLDRLALTSGRIRGIAEAVREIAGLPDPIGQVVRGMRTDIGLRVTQERVPLGVVGIIYEARPNVTIDAATLAIKAGNAVVLRGGSAAQSSNHVLIEVCRDALASVGLPADAITTVDPWGRAGARAMMRARGAIDALIPRGGAGLINAVVEESRVPVIETGTGNCHVYVDASADLEAAEAIIMNAKTQRVGVCNAAETLLVHADIAQRFLVAAVTRLTTAGVTIHADEATRAIVDGQPSIDADMIVDATEVDWETEYLSMDLAVRVVADVDEAIEHIRRYSSGHTEGIVASDIAAVRAFRAGIDAAAIAVNASTRFTDGGQLGLGADQLETIGRTLGADVPACLAGGIALGTGRGDHMSVLREGEEEGQHYWVMLLSHEGLSTPSVFREFDRVDAEQAPALAEPSPEEVAALCAGPEELRHCLVNDLQAPALRLRPHPAAARRPPVVGWAAAPHYASVRETRPWLRCADGSVRWFPGA